MSSIKLIGCVDKNWAIGMDNQLLFNIKNDSKLLQELTNRSIIVAGHNTYNQFPIIDSKKQIHGLAGRINLILTHDQNLIQNKDTYYLNPVLSALFNDKIDPSDEFIKYSFNVFGGDFKEILKIITTTDSDVFIIGGETTYNLFYKYCDEAYITKVDVTVKNANKFMPNLDEDPQWELSRSTDVFIDTDNELPYKFCVYKKSMI